MPDPAPGAETVQVMITCECGLHHEFTLRCPDVIEWKKGRHVALAFPYLNGEQNELLISKLCHQCFDRMYVEKVPAEDQDEEA